MSLTDILIPQLGEGLQEVVLLTVNKKPGDFVKRDELLYSMETDKAVMEVELPLEGVLTEWLATEGSVLAIGAPVARIETSTLNDTTPVDEPPVADSQPVAVVANSVEVQIPPRTRAHAKEHGLSEAEMRSIPAPSGKLMPADVDAYLAGRPTPARSSPPLPKREGQESGFVERPLSQQQRLFVHRLKRSAQTVVPATMKLTVDWSQVIATVTHLRSQAADLKPTEFQTFAYCVAQAVVDYPKFRSNLVSDEAAREYAHVNLGIAVARPNDDLVTAVVPAADSMSYADFVKTAQERIRLARDDGNDQAGADTHLLLTYMGAFGVVDAIPVLVSPAIAVLFIGSTYKQDGRTLANVVMTFDHRLINGVEAARFLQSVVSKAETIGDTLLRKTNDKS